MECPIEESTLVMADRNGVEIDHCPQCRGVWPDRGEPDRIIERATGPAAPQPAAPRPAARPGPRRDGEHRDSDRKPCQKKRGSFLEDLFDF